MFRRLRQWFRRHIRPHRCPDCGKKCESVQGLGRHRAAEARAKAKAAQLALPVVPEGPSGG